MRIVMFYHSLVSDWNHGNAHFLRGIVGELQRRGHVVDVYEPRNGWSRRHLMAEQGPGALEGFHRAYPHLSSVEYDARSLDLDAVLAGADVAIVHEWTDAELIHAIGEVRARRPALHLLFHDTHHRSVTDPEALGAYDLRHYDGVLAYGRVISERYLSEGWVRQAWTWHEAADTRVFRPCRSDAPGGDLVWIGNWADEERADELREFLLDPVRTLGIRATAYGVRYPPSVVRELAAAGIDYGGWLPNYEVPQVFGRFAITVHVPRQPYVEALPGIPTIRPFEALACGIPLVSAPWRDVERLFHVGEDLLVVDDGAGMTRALRDLMAHPEKRRDLSRAGLRTVHARHSCAHRVDELLGIVAALSEEKRAEVRA